MIGNYFMVVQTTITKNDGVVRYTCNKTFKEISSAFKNGCIVSIMINEKTSEDNYFFGSWFVVSIGKLEGVLQFIAIDNRTFRCLNEDDFPFFERSV